MMSVVSGVFTVHNGSARSTKRLPRILVEAEPLFAQRLAREQRSSVGCEFLELAGTMEEVPPIVTTLMVAMMASILE